MKKFISALAVTTLLLSAESCKKKELSNVKDAANPCDADNAALQAVSLAMNAAKALGGLASIPGTPFDLVTKIASFLVPGCDATAAKLEWFIQLTDARFDRVNANLSSFKKDVYSILANDANGGVVGKVNVIESGLVLLKGKPDDRNSVLNVKDTFIQLSATFDALAKNTTATQFPYVIGMYNTAYPVGSGAVLLSKKMEQMLRDGNPIDQAAKDEANRAGALFRASYHAFVDALYAKVNDPAFRPTMQVVEEADWDVQPVSACIINPADPTNIEATTRKLRVTYKNKAKFRVMSFNQPVSDEIVTDLKGKQFEFDIGSDKNVTCYFPDLKAIALTLPGFLERKDQYLRDEVEDIRNRLQESYTLSDQVKPDSLRDAGLSLNDLK